LVMLTRCATRSLPTSFGLTKCVMPKRSPHSFLPLLMSTPMIVERGVFANFRDRDLGQHGEIRERGRAHVMVQFLAVEREPRSAIGHEALALRRADRGAQIGLARQT